MLRTLPTPPDALEPRVLHLLTTTAPHARELVLSLVRSTPLVGYCAVASADYTLADEVNAHGAAFHRLATGSGKRAAARQGSAVRKAIQRVRPNVVHVHDVGAGVGLRFATLGRTAPPAIMSVYEEQSSYLSIARLLNLCNWTAIASGPTVGHELRDAGYQGRLRTILTGGSWHAPPVESIVDAKERWGLGGRYLVGLASDAQTEHWSTISEAVSRLEGMDLVVVDDRDSRKSTSDTRVDEFEALVAGSTAVVTSSANRPTKQILGPMSLGIPVVLPAQLPVQGWIPNDVAVTIDFSVEDLVGAVTSLVDPVERRTRSSLSRDAASGWATERSVAAFHDLYRARAGAQGEATTGSP